MSAPRRPIAVSWVEAGASERSAVVRVSVSKKIYENGALSLDQAAWSAACIASKIAPQGSAAASVRILLCTGSKERATRHRRCAECWCCPSSARLRGGDAADRSERGRPGGMRRRDNAYAHSQGKAKSNYVPDAGINTATIKTTIKSNAIVSRYAKPGMAGAARVCLQRCATNNNGPYPTLGGSKWPLRRSAHGRGSSA